MSRPIANGRLGVIALVALSLGAVTAGTLTSLHPAMSNAATTNTTINFQARLMTNTGAIVPDGNYNIEFKIYNAATSTGTPNQGACTMTPGTTADPGCLWTETRTGANVVTVANGYLTVNLGSVNAFPTTINWDQNLWLSMRVGGTGTPSWDPEMNTPGRLVMTGIPYAFRAGSLAQLNAGNGFESTLSLVQPTVGNQIFQVPDQAAAGTYNLLAQNSSNVATLQGAATLTAATTLTLQSGGTNNNLTVTAAGTGILAVDSGGSGTVNIGTVHATTVAVSNGSAATSILSGSTLVVGNNAVNKTISIGVTGSTANTTSLLLATSTGATQTIQIGGTGVTGGSASGTTVTLQGGATALKVANGGTTIQTFTDSVNAFQILDHTGTNTVFDVDTTNGFIGVGTATPAFSVDTIGDINSGGNYYIGGVQGLGASCSSGQGITNTQISGGIVIGGTCANAVSTLQNAYDNSTVTVGGTSTPTLVNTGTNHDIAYGFTGTTSGALTIQTSAAGNLLVASVGTANSSSNAPSVTSITGGGTWHLATVGPGANALTTRIEIWYCYNCGSTSSVTINLSGTATAAAADISEYSGVQTSSDPLETATGGTGSSPASATQVSPSITTVNANDLIVVGMSIYNNLVTSVSTPAGYNLLSTGTSGSNKKVYTDYKLGSSAGSYSATWTLTGGTGAGGVYTAAFKATAAGGTVAPIQLSGSKDLVVKSAAGNAELTVKADGSGLVIGSQSSDPTAVEGGMYYNSTTHTFRCAEGSSATWKNCALQYTSTIADSAAITTTSTAISGISLRASKNYTIHVVMPFVTTAAGTVSIALTTPTTPTLVSCQGTASTSATAVGSPNLLSAAGTGTFTSGSSGNTYTLVEECVVDNSTNAGTFALKISTSSGSITAKAGTSYSWYEQ